VTVFVSDVTTGDTPVGVDFYWVGERGEQYGPFGVLYPYANQTGRGYFRCSDPIQSNTTATQGDMRTMSNMLNNAGRHLLHGGNFFDKYPHLRMHKQKKH